MYCHNRGERKEHDFLIIGVDEEVQRAIDGGERDQDDAKVGDYAAEKIGFCL